MGDPLEKSSQMVAAHKLLLASAEVANRENIKLRAELERLRFDARAYANVMLSEENDALIEDNKRLRALLKAVVQEADRSTRAFDEAKARLGEGKG